MGSKKKPAKKIELEEEDTAIGSTSSIAAISDDDEEANKDLSLEIIHKALLNRAINPQNAAALNASTLIAPSKAQKEENKLRMKKKKKKKLESDREALNTVKVEEKEKVEHAEVDNDVLRNTTSKSNSEEIKSRKKKKKKRHESEIQTVNAVIVEEEEKKAVERIEDPEKGEPGVETINALEKVEHTEVETCIVDMCDSDVLRNTTSKLQSEESKTQKKKKKKNLEYEIQTENAVIVEEEEEKKVVETIEDLEKVEPSVAEPEVVDTSNNVVLRKLLRGPRYFDPPSDNVWGTCFNCGEEGHATFNCTAAKRKKPCFICGSLSHNVKKCTMARYCSTCKIVGHRTKDCPKKHSGGSYSKSLTVCLRCGNSGHDMLFCKNDYPEEDLKEIQCYVCKEFGHLCCVNTTEATLEEFSCYRCGKLGHVGWACSRLKGATNASTPSSCYTCGEQGHFARECSSSVKASSRWQSETTDPATPSSCYRCGEEGHFARECPSSVKGGNRKHKFSSTETPRSQKENDYMGYTSEPYTEESDIKTPKKSKHKGGWMSDHPSEFTPSNSRRDSWRSPVTPCTNNNSTPNHFVNNDSHNLNSKSFTRNVNGGTPNSEGSARTFHHGHSASRFGNSNSNGFRRSYNGW